MYMKQGNYDKALECSLASLTIQKNILGENHHVVAQSYYNTGKVYVKLENYEKAQEYFYKALSIQETLFDPEDPLTIKTKEAITEVQTKIKEQE